MTLFSSVAVYFVIWWLVLFVVLPFGVRNQHEAGDVTLGTDHGAPHQPYLLRKALATSVIAAVLFSGVYVFFEVYQKSLEDLLP